MVYEKIYYLLLLHVEGEVIKHFKEQKPLQSRK